MCMSDRNFAFSFYWQTFASFLFFIYSLASILIKWSCGDLKAIISNSLVYIKIKISPTAICMVTLNHASFINYYINLFSMCLFIKAFL